MNLRRKEYVMILNPNGGGVLDSLSEINNKLDTISDKVGSSNASKFYIMEASSNVIKTISISSFSISYSPISLMKVNNTTISNVTAYIPKTIIGRFNVQVSGNYRLNITLNERGFGGGDVSILIKDINKNIYLNYINKSINRYGTESFNLDIALEPGRYQLVAVVGSIDAEELISKGFLTQNNANNGGYSGSFAICGNLVSKDMSAVTASDVVY